MDNILMDNEPLFMRGPSNKKNSSKYLNHSYDSHQLDDYHSMNQYCGFGNDRRNSGGGNQNARRGNYMKNNNNNNNMSRSNSFGNNAGMNCYNNNNMSRSLSFCNANNRNPNSNGGARGGKKRNNKKNYNANRNNFINNNGTFDHNVPNINSCNLRYNSQGQYHSLNQFDLINNSIIEDNETNIYDGNVSQASCFEYLTDNMNVSSNSNPDTTFEVIRLAEVIEQQIEQIKELPEEDYLTDKPIIFNEPELQNIDICHINEAFESEMQLLPTIEVQETVVEINSSQETLPEPAESEQAESEKTESEQYLDLKPGCVYYNPTRENISEYETLETELNKTDDSGISHIDASYLESSVSEINETINSEPALEETQNNEVVLNVQSMLNELNLNSNKCTLNGQTYQTDKFFKLVFAGDSAVGKTSFIMKYCKGEFSNATSATLGVDFYMKALKLKNYKEDVQLQLWDTCGQERFRSIAKSYFRRADGVVLMYDVTCEQSFINVREWIQSINEITDRLIPIIIIGNKTDLRESAAKNDIKVIDYKDGLKFAKDHGALFIETSSKEGTNIDSSLIDLCQLMISNQELDIPLQTIKSNKFSLNDTQKKKISDFRKRCC